MSLSASGETGKVVSGEAGRKFAWGKFLSGKVLNLVLWWVFCGMAGTGLLLAWRLPSGSRGGKGLSAMGLGRHDWGDIHTWLGYGLIGLILIHLAVHWRWLWQAASCRRSWALLAGLGSGLVLLVFLVCQPVEHRGGGEGKREGKGAQFTGEQSEFVRLVEKSGE